MFLKMFSVQLSLGEQTWESEGSSIKKAQQAVANKALTESTLPKPVQKPPKSNVNNNPGMALTCFLLLCCCVLYVLFSVFFFIAGHLLQKYIWIQRTESMIEVFFF